MTDLSEYQYKYPSNNPAFMVHRIKGSKRNAISITGSCVNITKILSAYLFILLVGAGILDWYPFVCQRGFYRKSINFEENELVLEGHEVNIASLSGPFTLTQSRSSFFSLKETEYRLKQDDSLSLLAARFEISLFTLASYNGIHGKSDLKEGMTVFVPDSEGTTLALRDKKRCDEFIKDNPEWASYIKRLKGTQADFAFIPGVIPSLKVSGLKPESWFLLPLTGSITAEFGPIKEPLTGMVTYNNGIEITSMKNRQVVAAAEGVVSAVGTNRKYGRYVIIRHANDYHTFYSGLGRIDISNGDFLDAGDILGYMEKESGLTLHFSLYKDRKVVDPLNHLF